MCSCRRTEARGYSRRLRQCGLGARPQGPDILTRPPPYLQPREYLVKLPSKSLLNLATLAPLYPPSIGDNLTANQLLPLHIALYRHQAYEHQSSSPSPETFTAYIQTLPQDFSTVPLWREKTECKIWQRLVRKDKRLLPEGPRAKTEDVSKRFASDWEKVQHVWVNDVRL